MTNEFQKLNRYFIKIDEKTKQKYFQNNHRESKDEKSQKNEDDDRSYNQLHIPIFYGVCDIHLNWTQKF